MAYVISQAASPPVLGSAMMLWMASISGDSSAWRWASVYLLIAVALPLAYLIYLVRTDQVTDLDVQRREQRARPMIVSNGCMILAWLVILLGNAPASLVALAAALCILMAIVSAITLRWKISVHCATAASAATLAWFILDTPLPLLICAPVMSWSRVRLRRHTLAQTIAGSLLGLAVLSAVLFYGG